MSEMGIFVYKVFRYLAASPDSVTDSVTECCGKGLLEIKSPFSLQNEMLQIAMSKNSSCILVDGKYELKKICLLHITCMSRCLVKWQLGIFHF